MMHPQIEQEEIVERYVRRQLPPQEREAFEEHFFGCDECFEKLQAAERFHAGIRDASAKGLLDSQSQAAAAGRGAWWGWGFALTSCASVVLLLIAGWMYFGLIPRLREERDRVAADLQLERQARARTTPPPSPAEGAEANVALVMLQASRTGAKPAIAVLPPGAKHLVLWIEIGPSRDRRFRMDVTTTDNRPVSTLEHLERGPYGALVASLPADKLPTGDLRITLSGEGPPPASLVGDYQLRIEKR